MFSAVSVWKRHWRSHLLCRKWYWLYLTCMLQCFLFLDNVINLNQNTRHNLLFWNSFAVDLACSAAHKVNYWVQCWTISVSKFVTVSLAHNGLYVSVPCLSPVKTQIFMSALASCSMVCGTPSWSLSSTADAPNNYKQSYITWIYT